MQKIRKQNIKFTITEFEIQGKTGDDWRDTNKQRLFLFLLQPSLQMPQLKIGLSFPNTKFNFSQNRIQYYPLYAVNYSKIW